MMRKAYSKKKSMFISRNLSSLIIIIIYVFMAIVHGIKISFILSDQLRLLTVMLPYILYAIILDFILSRNNVPDKTLKIFAQILPAGVFTMQGITFLLKLADKKTFSIFSYLIWLFIAAPLFIASFQKEDQSKRLLFSLTGTGLLAAAYLYLTTMTGKLNKGSGAIIYCLSYFFMLYAASAIKKMPYLGIFLGILNAATLLWLRYAPGTKVAKTYGWDKDIVSNFELLIILTFILCLFICFAAVFQKKKRRR